MKLLKTIQRLVEEAETEYNKVLESNNVKEIERAEKNYEDSINSYQNQRNSKNNKIKTLKFLLLKKKRLI